MVNKPFFKMRKRILKIHPKDNVIVALDDLKEGEVIQTDQGDVYLNATVKKKHKFAQFSLPKDTEIIMYGVSVGKAIFDIQAGNTITTDNIVHYANKASLNQISPYDWDAPDVSKWANRTFNGYHRADGKVGTANYWIFIPLVFCENRNLRVIEEALIKSLGYYRPNDYEQFIAKKLGFTHSDSIAVKKNRIFENIDGIKFLYHDGGCGGTRQDAETLIRLLIGYTQNPNVAGATVLSLGCQNAQIKWFQDILKADFPHNQKQIYYLEQQGFQSADVLIRNAIDLTLNGLAEANKIERKPAPLSQLTVGLECGGSDGFSGISANPAVGYTSDLIVSLGGTTLLSEFPELNGVEQHLVDRCQNKAIAQKFLDLQSAYEAAANKVGSSFANNPSPGNIKDGLITDAIKSAGAAKKGGTALVSDVLDYTESIKNKGLNLLCTPGNDVESTTGLAGSGANIILFTTGLGTPTGNPITPVIKIASNSALASKMIDIIDVNAGLIIEGEKSIQDVGEEILEKIISVASGEATRSMQLDQNDFIPWKRGVSL